VARKVLLLVNKGRTWGLAVPTKLWALWVALSVLATTTDKRLSLRPDLLTISEAGVPGYAASVWFGLAATAGTPEPVLTKIHAEVVKTLADPVYRAKFVTAQSLEPGGMSRAEFAALLKSEEVRWGQLVRESGAKIE
jgi:tripartite-type tricarboxylate transporter receptor subunit TctC